MSPNISVLSHTCTVLKRSPDVDVIVAFVNPVTIVPMDEHNLLKQLKEVK
jgi:hypothetical protein